MNLARLSAIELAALRPRLRAWQIDIEPPALRRQFRFATFREAFGFMAAVAAIAEQRNHHPEWSNVYATVDVLLTTHESGGVTAADVDLAQAIDALAEDHYPPSADETPLRLARGGGLDGLRVVVTGGSGAIGRALGSVLEHRGARVALLDRTPAAVSATPGPGADGSLKLGGVDLTDPDSTRTAFESVAASFGGIDALVNVAGGFVFRPFLHPDVEDWVRMHTLNVGTAVVATRAALPHLLSQARSSIVNVSALAATRAAAGMGPYAAAKAGIEKLTESLAAEFVDRGLRANAVMPSIVDTPHNRREMPAADHNKWVKPAELSELICFLVSDASSAITGACIPVAGRA